MIRASTAVLAVKDLPKSADFYVNVLGFRQNWLWGNPPTFGCVGLGASEIFLCQQPDLAARVDGHMHCFFLDDVEPLHAQHQASGAPIVSPIENKPWGIREYTVRDPSGYHLRFGGPQKYDPPPGALTSLPSHIRIEPRLVSLDEYRDLQISVSWNVDEAAMPEALQASCLGVVAIDTRDDTVVGMLRMSGGGRHFVIWDVIVRPSHQAQRIGSTMIDAALAELRKTVKPGAYIGLFTGKPSFYERLGFKPGGGMSRTL